MNRRDFLRLTGSIAGGIIINSCSRGGDSGGALPVPNGYRFFRIAGPGSTLPDGRMVAKVGAGSMMNGKEDVIMYADDSVGRGGMYELTMNYGGSRPAIDSIRKVVARGDTIGGFQVGIIGYGSSNSAGQHACILKMNNGVNGVFADMNRTGMRPIVLPTGTTGGTDDPELSFHGYFGDVDLNDRGGMLIKAVIHTPADPLAREGVVHRDAGGNKSVLAEEGDELPGGNEKIQGFGLLDLASSNGFYAIQVFGPGQAAIGSGLTAAKRGFSAMVRGRVDETLLRSKTLAASAGASLKKVQRAAAMTGNIQYGPRIGNDGRVAQVIHKADDFPVLTYDGNEIISKGDVTPLGHVVTSIGAPIVDDSGLVFAMLESANKTAELCIYNGVSFTTVLATGDPVDTGTGTAAIRGFAFGVLRDMMDDTGRLVMTGAFDDGNHVVVGIPY